MFEAPSVVGYLIWFYLFTIFFCLFWHHGVGGEGVWSAGWIIPGHRERYEGNTQIKVERVFSDLCDCTVSAQTNIFTAFVFHRVLPQWKHRCRTNWEMKHVSPLCYLHNVQQVCQGTPYIQQYLSLCVSLNTNYLLWDISKDLFLILLKSYWVCGFMCLVQGSKPNPRP